MGIGSLNEHIFRREHFYVTICLAPPNLGEQESSKHCPFIWGPELGDKLLPVSALPSKQQLSRHRQLLH